MALPVHEVPDNTNPSLHCVHVEAEESQTRQLVSAQAGKKKERKKTYHYRHHHCEFHDMLLDKTKMCDTAWLFIGQNWTVCMVGMV